MRKPLTLCLLTCREDLTALHNLGLAFGARFDRTSELADMDRAVAMNKRALDGISSEHPHRRFHRNALGAALLRRFEKTGEIEDLNEAILEQKKALEIAPKDIPDTNGLNNLGVAFQRRYHHLGNILDLNEAIHFLEEALERLPLDHPNRAVCLTNIAAVYQQRFESAGFSDDRIRAIQTNEQASKIPTAPPSLRIKGAQSAAKLLSRTDLFKASSLLRLAVELLPSVSPRTLTRTDQQYNLSNFMGLASDAASFALEIGSTASEALHVLEVGRGVMANLFLEVRSEVASLEELHPTIATEFKQLRDVIDLGDVYLTVPINCAPISTSSQRHFLVEKFNSLLTSIRKLRGFERFLLGPSEVELNALAASHPIVVLNVSELRSDAIILARHDIKILHLPELKYSELGERAKVLLLMLDNLGDDGYLKCSKTMKNIQEWLWDVAISQILDYLGFKDARKADMNGPVYGGLGVGG